MRCVGIVRTAEWLLTTPPDDAADAVRRTLEPMATDVQVDGRQVRAQTKRSLRENKWAADLSVRLDAAPEDRTLAVVSVEMNGTKHYEIMDQLADGLGELVDDRGVAACVDRLGGGVRKSFTRRELGLIQHMLHGDERVVEIGQGVYGGKMGIVVLTNRRLFYFEKSWASQTVEEFPLKSISSVSVESKGSGEKLKIHSSGNVSDIEHMTHGQGDAFARQIRNLMQERDAPPAAAAAAPSAGDRLKQLVELHDAGILTDAEFEAKRSELLAQL